MLILVVCFSFLFCFSKGATLLTQCTSRQTSKLHTIQHRRPWSLQGVWRSRDDVMIELKNWLPTSLCDLDEAYKDNIVCCDTTPAPDPPGWTLARQHWENLLRSQSRDIYKEESDSLTSTRNSDTARAMRVATASSGIVLCACD